MINGFEEYSQLHCSHGIYTNILTYQIGFPYDFVMNDYHYLIFGVATYYKLHVYTEF